MHPILQAVGLGKFGSNGHPIHPSTVHWPLAFLSTAHVLDILYSLVAGGYVSLESFGLKFPEEELALVGLYCHALGVLTAIPATITGVLELYAMISSKGLWQRISKESDGSPVYSGLNPTVRIGLIHAALNDLALAASAQTVWQNIGASHYEPGTGVKGVWSVVVLAAIMWSGYLGGSLVYEYGVAVQRMGVAAQIKEDMKNDEVIGFEGNEQLVKRKGQ